MKNKFLYWKKGILHGCFHLEPLPYDLKTKEHFDMELGQVFPKKWPLQACFRMTTTGLKKGNAHKYSADSTRPGGVLPVISETLKIFLEQEAKSKTEFLPVLIEPTLGRKKSEINYFLLNPLECYDFIDTKKSGVEWNDLDPDSILDFKKIVVKEKEVPTGSDLFLAKHFGNRIFISRNLFEKLSAKFTDLRFLEIKEIDSFNV